MLVKYILCVKLNPGIVWHREVYAILSFVKWGRDDCQSESRDNETDINFAIRQIKWGS